MAELVEKFKRYFAGVFIEDNSALIYATLQEMLENFPDDKKRNNQGLVEVYGHY